MIFWIIFEVLVNIFQGWLYLFFVKNRLNIVKPHPFADTLSVVLYSLFLTYHMYFSPPFPDSIGAIIFFVYLLLVSDHHWFTCAFWLLLEEVICVSVISILLQFNLALFKVPLEVLLGNNYIRIAYVLTSNLILFLVMFLVSKIHISNSPLTWLALALFTCINFTMLVAIEFIFSILISSSKNAPLFLSILCLLLLFCSACTLTLYHVLTTVYQQKQDAIISLNHYKLTQQHQNNLNAVYNDMIVREHDFAQHLQTIETMLQSGNTTIAKEYFTKYKETSASHISSITNNSAIDAILTAKLIICKSNQIDLHITGYPLSSPPISSIDLCVIVGNLLDNAIEGTNRIHNIQEQKWIRLIFSRVWDNLIIQCENNYESSSIRKVNDQFISSKEKNHALHGFGISNIRKIVNKSNGICSFEVTNTSFLCMISLPYPILEGDYYNSLDCAKTNSLS